MNSMPALQSMPTIWISGTNAAPARTAFNITDLPAPGMPPTTLFVWSIRNSIGLPLSIVPTTTAWVSARQSV